MINIERLQKKIDNALEKESKESLSNWIFSKRFPEFNRLFCKLYQIF